VDRCAVPCTQQPSHNAQRRGASGVPDLRLRDNQENTLIFSQIGKDEESKTAYYFKNWQKEGEEVVLDLFNWGSEPVRPGGIG